jgi:hypothetical protein
MANKECARTIDLQGAVYPVSERVEAIIALVLAHAEAIDAIPTGRIEVRFDRVHVSRSLYLGSMLHLDRDPPAKGET